LLLFFLDLALSVFPVSEDFIEDEIPEAEDELLLCFAAVSLFLAFYL
jgi:hypothetical protein